MPAERPNYIVPRNGIGAGRHFLLLLSLAFIASCEFSLSERQNPELVFSEDYSELDVFYNDPDFLKEETRDLYGKAMVQIRNGDFQQAREKLLQAKALEPENAAILFNLGNLALEDSEYQQALEYYGMVSNDSVVNSHQRYGIGSTYFSMGEYEYAIGSLERILVNSRNEVLHAGAYYLLTKSYAELQRCEESRASLQSFKELTGHQKDFRVMTQELEFWALNCGKSSKRQELWVNSGNRNHEFELRTYSLRDSLTASPDSTAQFSRVTDIHLLLDSIPRSKRIWKKDFEYYLYRDFYAKAFIHSTQVHAVSDGTAYLSTRMTTLDSSRHALIWCSFEVLENHLGELQVIRVQYPEE